MKPPETPTLQFLVPVNLDGKARIFIWLFGIMMAIVVLWGSFAELHSGTMAMGEVAPMGRSKTVQHLEGGIIRDIKVRDGDRVLAGEELVLLDDVEVRAALAIAESEQISRAALAARLIAERDGTGYRPRQNTPNGSVRAQLRLFEMRRTALSKEIASLNLRNEGLRRELAAWQEKADALNNLVAQADEEKSINQGLYEKNFISKPRLLALESRSSETRASRGESQAEIARVRQRISDTDMQLNKLKNDWMSVVLEDLRRAQDDLAVSNEKARVAKDRLSRIRIVAPQDGIVKGVRTLTLGAVVAPGGTLLDIVPIQDRMIIETRIPPEDIDVVRIGTPCRVRLTAYKARAHLRLAGIVRDVSAATFHDDKTGAAHFIARVEVSESKTDALNAIMLQPGMLAEVEIIGGSRTPVRYLIDPVIQSFARAFKEK